jgi:D-alanyl-D-alanine carboxypeptidase (penicillin-binding protein 5/6)
MRPHRRRRPRLTSALAAAAILAVGVTTAAGASADVGARQTGAAAPSVKARSGILIDRRSGKVLWSKSPDLRLAPASCAKIMTALIVLERYRDLGRYVRVPSAATAHKTIAVGLQPGDRITVQQALRALMVMSANDAAITLAYAVGGSEAGFVLQMNLRARQLGLAHTHFANCRGTPEPELYSSARDLAELGRYAMRDARFRAIVSTRTTVIRWPTSHAVRIESHNRLLDYPWGDGIKTGSTKKSKRVLVGSGKPGPVPLIVVTMREPSRDREEKDAVALLLWGSDRYEQLLSSAGGE